MRRTIMAASVALLALAGSAGVIPSAHAGTAQSRAHASAGQLVIAQGVDPLTLDAQRTTVQQALNVSMQIEEPLLQLYFYPHKRIAPWLATSMKARGNTAWDVTLRSAVKFTDGEPFDANAVKFSIQRIQRLKTPALDYVSPITKITVVNATHLRFTTNGPAPTLPLFLTHIPMVPPKYIQKVGDTQYGLHPVGTGPYTFVDWVKDDHVTLAANKHYWGTKPTLSRVVFRSIPESSTRMAALQTGEVDAATQVDVNQAAALQGAGIHIVHVASLRSMFIQLDLTKPGPLMDVRVRQALNYAVDKESLIKVLLQGYTKPLQGQPLTKDYFGYNPSVTEYKYSPSKAETLLKKAGYTASHPLSLTLMVPSGRYLHDKEIGEAIGGELQKVGIHATVNVLDWGLFLNKLVAKQLTPMAFWGAATVPDASAWIPDMLGGSGSYSMWKNAQFDALVTKAGHTVKKAERLALYHSAEKLAHDQAPLVYLYQEPDVYGLNKRVSAFQPNPDESIYLAGVHTK